MSLSLGWRPLHNNLFLSVGWPHHSCMDPLCTVVFLKDVSLRKKITFVSKLKLKVSWYSILVYIYKQALMKMYPPHTLISAYETQVKNKTFEEKKNIHMYLI